MTASRLVSFAVSALLLGSAPSDLYAELQQTAQTYRAHIAAVAPVAGRDTTYDYYQRLLDDTDLVQQKTPPPPYTQAQWTQLVENTASLDISLATQLLSGEYRSMASIRGLGETLVRSSRDGTMQPVAVYVPSSYVPGSPAPLVVFLHGHGQAETSLLAPFYITQLAEQSGAILIAPWGHGYYDYRASQAEVYDALQAAEQAFTIDSRQRYLAGYSMGGFSVFVVAPVHPEDWAGVMCIAGGLLGSDSRRLVTYMRTKPFYVLTGSQDEVIPTYYPTTTTAYLQAAGFEVSFYSQPGGTHRLVSLMPILTQAWSDMFHHVIRAPPPQFGALELPAAIPTMALKP